MPGCTIYIYLYICPQLSGLSCRAYISGKACIPCYNYIILSHHYKKITYRKHAVRNFHKLNFCVKIFTRVLKQQNFLTMIYVTLSNFAKRGLPHTSNLQTLTFHNLRLEQVINLQFGQQ